FDAFTACRIPDDFARDVQHRARQPGADHRRRDHDNAIAEQSIHTDNAADRQDVRHGAQRPDAADQRAHEPHRYDAGCAEPPGRSVRYGQSVAHAFAEFEWCWFFTRIALHISRRHSLYPYDSGDIDAISAAYARHRFAAQSADDQHDDSHHQHNYD